MRVACMKCGRARQRSLYPVNHILYYVSVRITINKAEPCIERPQVSTKQLYVVIIVLYHIHTAQYLRVVCQVSGNSLIVNIYSSHGVSNFVIQHSKVIQHFMKMVSVSLKPICNCMPPVHIRRDSALKKPFELLLVKQIFTVPIWV